MEIASARRIVEEAVSAGRMVIVVGKCKVQYAGRAASKLSEGDRLLVIKHDGTFLVHQSTKMRAINYQGPGARITTEAKGGELLVTATRKKPKEEITVRFQTVLFAESFSLKDDEKLRVFGSEKELAELLLQDLAVIEKGLKPLKHESSVKKGTIDILAEDRKGRLVVIEVKRRTAGLDAVTQLARYVRELEMRKDRKTRGCLCAPSVTPNALKMLEGEGLEYFKLDYEISNPSSKIKGLEKKQKTLEEY